MQQIDSVSDDDVMSFVCMTNEALDIDSHYRPTAPIS